MQCYSENNFSSFLHGRMLLRWIYFSLWFSLSVERVLHALKKKKKENLQQVFMSLKCQCDTALSSAGMSLSVPMYLSVSSSPSSGSVHNVGSWTFSFLKGWSVLPCINCTAKSQEQE